MTLSIFSYFKFDSNDLLLEKSYNEKKLRHTFIALVGEWQAKFINLHLKGAFVIK